MKNRKEEVFSLKNILDLRELFHNQYEEVTLNSHMKKHYKNLIFIMSIMIVLGTFAPFLNNIAATIANQGKYLFAITIFIGFNLLECVKDLLKIKERETMDLFKLQMLDFIYQKCVPILMVVQNRIKTNLKGTNVEKTETKPAMLITLVDYFSQFFSTKLQLLLLIIDITSFVVSIMLILFVAGNQFMNLPILLIVLVITFLIIMMIAVRRVKREYDYYHTRSEIRKSTESARNDLLNTRPSCQHHFDILCSHFLEKKTLETITDCENRKKNNKDDAYINLTIAVSIVILTLINLFQIKTFALGEFLLLTAFANTYSRILTNISNLVNSFYELISCKMGYEAYSEGIKIIMDTYETYKKIEFKVIHSDRISIPPFHFCYYQTDHTKTFQLIATKDITIKKGTVTLLQGKSGSGKSTLVKLLIGDLSFSKEIENTKINAIGYFDSDTIGSSSLLQEITFASKETVDFLKLIEILNGIQLADKLSLLQLGKEEILDKLDTMYADSLSGGLSQRILLARTMYHLENSDFVFLDEPITNLDAITAKKVMQFLITYSQKDKKRFLLIVSHQHLFIEDEIDEVYNFELKTSDKSYITCQ